jgi:hypothetical protein
LIISKILAQSGRLVLESYIVEGNNLHSKKPREESEEEDPPAKKLRVEEVITEEEVKTAEEEEKIECRVCMKSVDASSCPKVTASCEHENLVCGECLMKSCEADLNTKGELKVRLIFNGIGPLSNRSQSPVLRGYPSFGVPQGLSSL